MGQFHVDNVILGQNLYEQCAKMFVARIGLMVALEGAHVRNQVVIWHPMRVCAKFGSDRVNGCRDKSRTARFSLKCESRFSP